MNQPEPTVLRSAANPKLKHLLRMRDNRARRRAASVLVDGWRETAQAISAGLNLRGVYLPAESAIQLQSSADPAIGAVVAAAGQRGQLHWVDPSMMQRISFGQSARGVVAEFERPQRTLQSLSLAADPLVLILDRIEKPGNLGAIFRTADAAGVDAVLLCDSCCDEFSPNAIRSSLGAVFRVPSACGDEQSLGSLLAQHRLRPVAARVESAAPLWSANLRPPLAIILGSEAEGLQHRWRRLADQEIEGVQVPMFGEVDSLNVSVSAAILLYEAARRRHQPQGSP